MLNNKKAQVGESITWVIATIILIILLIISIYASIALASTKSLKFNTNTDSEQAVDWISYKTQMAYSINNNNKNKIEDWISQAKTDE
jgi:uncharacterized protein YpmB